MRILGCFQEAEEGRGMRTVDGNVSLRLGARVAVKGQPDAAEGPAADGGLMPSMQR